MIAHRTGPICGGLGLRPSDGASRARRNRRGRARDGGFTLFELLFAVATIGILAGIAYPSYVGYKVRANRAVAQAFLLDLASREQQYFLDARRYAADISGLGVTGIPPDVAGYYVIAAPVVDNSAAPPTFMISASARSGTIQAADGDLSIDSTGVRAGRW